MLTSIINRRTTGSFQRNDKLTDLSSLALTASVIASLGLFVAAIYFKIEGNSEWANRFAAGGVVVEVMTLIASVVRRKFNQEKKDKKAEEPKDSPRPSGLFVEDGGNPPNPPEPDPTDEKHPQIGQVATNPQNTVVPPVEPIDSSRSPSPVGTPESTTSVDTLKTVPLP